MSLQNLTKENNYKLYIGELVTPGLDLDNISTNSINSLQNGTNVFTLPTPASGNETIVNSDLVTTTDLAHSLGAVGKGFRNVFCQNLAGLSGPVSIQYGLEGKINTPPPGDPPLPNDPLIIYQNGLIFVNPSNTTDNSILNYYREYTQADLVLNIGGVYANPPSPLTYKATIIGNIVTMSILVPDKSHAPGPTGQIIISGLTSNFAPSAPQSIQINVNSNGSIVPGVLYIDTAALITIYPGFTTSTSFTNGVSVGLGIIESVGNVSYFTFSYIL